MPAASTAWPKAEGLVVARVGAERVAVFRLAAIDQSEAALDRIMANLGPSGRRAATVGVDFTDAQACAALADRLLQRFSRIDGLVNTVGTFAMAGIEEADPAQWDLMFKVDLSTALNMCRAVLPSMRAAGRGSIANVEAGPAQKATKGLSAYAASKNAVLRLTESIADELKAHGVRANSVLPSTAGIGVFMASPRQAGSGAILFCVLGFCDALHRRIACPCIANWLATSQELDHVGCRPAGDRRRSGHAARRGLKPQVRQSAVTKRFRPARLAA